MVETVQDSERPTSPGGSPTFDEVVRVPSALGAGDGGKGKAIRIEDVAREAGVSPITVSRVLRSPDVVSPATRTRVLAVVQRTGYVSNPHASALRSGRSSIVAAFLSNIFSQQYNDAATGCAEVLEEAGYQLMIGQTSYSYSRETAAIQALRALKPAGIFMTGVVELESNRRAMRELGIPIVESWALPRDPIDMLVGLSNTDAGRMACEHLVSRGRRRLAFVGRRGGRGRLRLKGFEEKARELGVEIVFVREVENVQSISDGHAILREVAAEGSKADAVFVANDLLAIGAVLEARRLGLSVPDDLAILGIGDSDFAAQITPSLSVVAFDATAIGRRAGRLIAERLSGTAPIHPIEHVEMRLAQRQST